MIMYKLVTQEWKIGKKMSEYKSKSHKKLRRGTL